jgi:hypothetical protein
MTTQSGCTQEREGDKIWCPTAAGRHRQVRAETDRLELLQ